MLHGFGKGLLAVADNVSGENFRWIISGLVTAIGAISALLFSSQSNELDRLKSVSAQKNERIAEQGGRITVLEAGQNEQRRRLERFETKLDLIIDKLNGSNR